MARLFRSDNLWTRLASLEYGELPLEAGTVHAITAALLGAGTLSPTLVEVKTAGTTMLGAGTLAAAPRVVRGIVASLLGAGTVAAAPVKLAGVSATLEGAGTVAASLARVRPFTASLLAAGTLAATVVEVPVGAGPAAAPASDAITARVAGQLGAARVWRE
jgi:hypothetical protein